MKIFTSTPIKVLGFFLLISILFSCTKDSDLLADYVLQDSIEQLAQDSSEAEEQTPQDPPPDDSTPSEDYDSGPLKAFPSAYGGGSNASGGRGKLLAIITTLDRNQPLENHAATGDTDEYYEGGLYAAMQNSDVGYIVFNVSGNIDLGVNGVAAQFEFDGMPGVNNKTIFGQSAPQGGITLTGGTFKLNARYGDNKNIIIRYLRSRPIYNRYGVLDTADDPGVWGFLLFGGQNIILDHCSASFAQDKAMGGYITGICVPDNPLENITFSNNLLGASGTGMYVEINPNQATLPQDYVDIISFHNNVTVSMNRTPNIAFNGQGEKINNVLHDTPTKQSTTYWDAKIDEIGNYYSNSSGKNRIRIDLPGQPKIYSSDNYFEGLLSGKESMNIEIWETSERKSPSSSYFVNAPFGGFPNPITPVDPEIAYENLIENGNVGAYKYLDDSGNVQIYRDSFDTDQLAVVKSNGSYDYLNPNNWVLPTIPHSQRPDDFDTDKDGMSDAWEMEHFGSLNESYRGDFNGDGYENIEEYMNQVDFN